ncbi:MULTISPECIES: phage antirepressor KilAC domain-containing protein [unclassified Carboxylicivirga]|uniref:phage antirepressor KilAC domain-containing protein n=1 Tax=Carboxylicivirga TaxID=1628153 RepID=UPI003D3383EB
MEVATIKTTMSSREIAELTGKRHDHVCRDINNLNGHYANMGLPKVGEGYYTHPNTGSQQHREYLLTKMQTFDLMTGYNAELRIKVNRRWEELEKTKGLPDFSNPAIAARAWADEVEKKMLAEAQIKEQAPKVLFADSVTASKKSILIGELAKILRQNGIEIGQNRLFSWMRENNFLCKHGEKYNRPTQRAMELGLFEVIERTISRPDKEPLVSITTKVTGKGQVYFINKFLSKKAC